MPRFKTYTIIWPPSTAVRPPAAVSLAGSSGGVPAAARHPAQHRSRLPLALLGPAARAQQEARSWSRKQTGGAARRQVPQRKYLSMYACIMSLRKPSTRACCRWKPSGDGSELRLGRLRRTTSVYAGAVFWPLRRDAGLARRR